MGFSVKIRVANKRDSPKATVGMNDDYVCLKYQFLSARYCMECLVALVKRDCVSDRFEAKALVQWLLPLLWRETVIDVCCMFEEKVQQNVSLRSLFDWPTESDLKCVFDLRNWFFCHNDKQAVRGERPDVSGDLDVVRRLIDRAGAILEEYEKREGIECVVVKNRGVVGDMFVASLASGIIEKSLKLLNENPPRAP